MSSEKRWKSLVIRWTAPKGFTAAVLFFALTLLIEYLLVSFFLSSGLRDESAFPVTFQVPSTSWFLVITVSPLFHFIPIGVIVVLISSWMYLTKRVAVMPRRTGPVRKRLTVRKKRYSKAWKMRLRSIRRLKALYHRLSSAILRVRGVSYVLQRLFFAKAAIRSTVTILAIFSISLFLLYLLGHPRFIYDAVISFFEAKQSFHSFVLQTINIGQGVAKTLSPIGWLASAMKNALLAAAPDFRNTLEASTAPVVEPVVKLDLIGKYTFCQYAAAFISALTALLYGEYAPRLRRRRP